MEKKLSPDVDTVRKYLRKKFPSFCYFNNKWLMYIEEALETHSVQDLFDATDYMFSKNTPSYQMFSKYLDSLTTKNNRCDCL
jgi:hypothetical protein